MPDNLQNRFLLEAKRLWELEMGISRLTSIHAAQVLHGALNCNGLSTLGDFYTSQAVIMAHNLRIFQPAPTQMNPRLRRGREYTAWGLWLWQVALVRLYSMEHCVLQAPLGQTLWTAPVHLANLGTELLLSARTISQRTTSIYSTRSRC